MLHLIIGDLKSFSKVTNKFSPMTGVLTCNTWLEQPRLSLCSDFLSCEDNAAFTLVLPLVQCTADVTVQAALFCTVLDALVQCSVGSLLLLVLASPSLVHYCTLSMTECRVGTPYMRRNFIDGPPKASVDQSGPSFLQKLHIGYVPGPQNFFGDPSTYF